MAMQVYSTFSPINYSKNRMIKLLKKRTTNANPTNGQKISNAGHVQTGQTKYLIRQCGFLSFHSNGVPNNCVFYK
jgi:hypothetical protein